MSSEQSDIQRQIVLNLLCGAVPEQKDKIIQLWTLYGPAVEIAPDSPGAMMNADRNRIKFTLKTIDIYWLLSFSTWKSIEVYSPAICMAVQLGCTIQKILDNDADLDSYERDYKARMAAVQTLIAVTTTAEIHWPPDTPPPQSDREKLSNPQDQAAFDLSALAIAFLLLHEFKHVIFLNEGNQPDTLPEEEIACDVWAREFLTAKLAKYANEYGHDFDEVRAKRAAAIALAAIIVYIITPVSGHWGTSDYPPISNRLDALIQNFSLPPNSYFWLWTACLLTGVLRGAHRSVEIKGKSARDLVIALLDELR